MLSFDKSVIASIADDDSLTWPVIWALSLSVILAFFVSFFTSDNPVFDASFVLALVFFVLFVVFLLFISSGIIYLFAKLLGGSGTYLGLLRLFGLISGFIIVVYSIFHFVLPENILNELLTIYDLVLSVNVVSVSQKISNGRAFVAVVVLPLLLLLLLFFIAFLLLGSLFFSAFA